MSIYPRDEELLKIEKWDLIEGDNKSHQKLYDLIEYVRDLWTYDDRVCLGKIRKHRWMKGRIIRPLYLSTGGWSGNEDIINALQKNFLFWSMYWFKSQRGGHYWFEIPPRKEK